MEKKSNTAPPPVQDETAVANYEHNGPVGNSIAKAKENPSVELSIGEMPDAMAIESLDEMDEGKSRIAKYRSQEDWQMLKDKPIRCIYLGMKEIPGENGDLIKAAAFADKTGVFISAQVVLMDAVMYLPSMFPLIVTYTGKKKNKSSEGSTNMFDVKELILEKKKA